MRLNESAVRRKPPKNSSSVAFNLQRIANSEQIYKDEKKLLEMLPSMAFQLMVSINVFCTIQMKRK